MPTENVTTKFKVDISDLKKNIQTANNQIKLLTAEMKNANAGMAKGAETTDSLSTKIQKQGQIVQQEEKKLQALKNQLSRLNQNQQQGEKIIADLTAKHQKAVEVYGEASDEAAAYAKQLKQAEAAQERNRSAAEKLNLQIVNQDTAVKNAKAAQNQYKTALDDMLVSAKESTTATETLTQKIEKQQSELNDLKQRYIDVTTAQGNNSNEAQALAQQIGELSSELNDNKKRLNEASNAADDLDVSLQDVDDSANETTNGGLSVFGVALGNLAADIIANVISKMKDMVTQTIEVGKTFESSMSNVAALSGATGDELQMLSDTAKEYGSTTKYSASEAADALGFMALAGWDANQSADALGGVLNLAAASGMDLAAASDMVTDYMSAFGLQADKSAYFADLLAYAQANANTTAAGLGDAFKNSAANMNAAGQDIETTISLLAMLANQGLKGSEAGTALTAAMRDMTSKMKDGKIAIGETSVEVMDANGNYRDMTDILADVEAATQGMGDAEKASALQATFTSDSIKGLNLILNAGVGEAAAFENELRNSSGAAEEMAAVMGDNLSGDVTALGSKLEGIQIAIYEKFEPALRAGTEILNKLLDGFSFLVDHSTEVVAALGAIAAGVASYLVYTTALKVMTDGWKALTLVTKAQAAAQAALNVVMSLNPIGLVIAGIVALVAAFVILWKKSEKFRKFWKGLWEKVKSAAEPVFEKIKKFFTDLWEKAQPIIDKIKDAIDTAITEITEMMTLAWGAIQAIWNHVEPYFSMIWENIKAIFSVVSTVISGYFSVAWELIKLVWDVAVQYFSMIWENIKVIFSAVKDTLGAFFESAWESIKAVWDIAVGYFQMIWDNIKLIFSVVQQVLSGDFSGAWDSIKKIWDNAKTYFQTVWNSIKTIFGSVKSFFKKAFSNAWEAIKGVFKNVGTFFGGIWDTIKEKFTTIGTTIGDAIGGAFKTAINAVITVVENGLNTIPDAVNSALDLINELPGVDIGQIPTISLPRLAKGGIVDRPTLAEIGENGSEAILPLEKNKAGLKKIASLIANEINSNASATGNTSGGNVYNFNQTNNSPKALSRWEIYRQTKNLINAVNVANTTANN